MRSEPLTVLGAGPGLGFYVPAAILARRVRRARPVDLVILPGAGSRLAVVTICGRCEEGL